jgi:hypothetical protein
LSFIFEKQAYDKSLRLQRSVQISEAMPKDFPDLSDTDQPVRSEG